MSSHDLDQRAWASHLAAFSGDADDFRGWVFTIARHRAIDHGRARAARPSVPVADPGDVQDAVATRTSPSAEVEAIERDATQQALVLVATLPPEQAEMVMLRVVAGLDVETVAAMVGKKPGTVRVAVHRALKTLKNQTPGGGAT